MLRITLILPVFFFSLAGNLFSQNFTITFDVDFLNDGKKKSVLITNENGHFLHSQNFKPKGFEKDFVMTFDKKGSSEVHLTVFKKKLNSAGAVRTRSATTFCNILNGTIINFIEDVHYHSEYFLEGGSEPEEKLIDIHGIRSLEDLVSENENYSITKSKIRKDSILRLRIERAFGTDALIFMKINGEAFHRQLFLPGFEEMPSELTIDDLTYNIKLKRLDLPFKGIWSAGISVRNLESDHKFSLYPPESFFLGKTVRRSPENEIRRYSLRTRELRRTELKSFFYPVPEEIVLSNYKVFLRYTDDETGFSHTYRQFFEQAPTKVFHYDNFDFEVFDESDGIELFIHDKSDYFQVNTSYKGMSNTLSTITLFPWHFVGQVAGKNKLNIVYPKEIPTDIQKHLKGNWDAIGMDLKKISVIKFPYTIEKEDWERPIDFLYMLREDSYHECSQSFRN